MIAETEDLEAAINQLAEELTERLTRILSELPFDHPAYMPRAWVPAEERNR